MGQLKLVETEDQKKEYEKLCGWCFLDSVGWTKNVFPLSGADSYALGLYNSENQLETGAISLRLMTRYYNQEFLSSGISAVISDPAARNGGKVREVIGEILRREKKTGSLFSSLCPFSHPFYQKFGYGAMGFYPSYSFAPDDIKDFNEEGNFSPFLWREKDESKVVALKNGWLKQFHGGILEPMNRWSRQKELVEVFKERAYQLVDKEGRLKAWIVGKIKEDNGEAVLDIYKMIWDSSKSLRALFQFLKQFRGQVSRIILRMPGNVPVFSMLKSPRIHKTDEAEWMGRPLDVITMLQWKVQFHDFRGEWSFKLNDPVLNDNSGVYTIAKGKVSFSAKGSASEIPFYIFSSLLLGGISLESCRIGGLVAEDIPVQVDDLFPVLNNIFITDAF